MNDRKSIHSLLESRSNDVLADYFQRIDRGERVDQKNFIDDNVEVAASLREYFEDWAAIANDGVELESAQMEQFPTATSIPPLPIEQIRDYRLLSRIGIGGMGEIYRAEHMRLGKLVALKLMRQERLFDPAAVARFEREIKVIGRLDHPNIVRAFDAGEEGGYQFLVMELVEGITLDKLIRRIGALRICDACALVVSALNGMQYAHERNLVHRDIKPSNLILTLGGDVKILDFGIAALMDDLGSNGLTKSSDTLGTIDYVAPEQVQNASSVDIRADIFSLGCTLFKLILNRTPFDDKEQPIVRLLARLTEKARDPREFRPEIPAGLAEVIAKALATSPDDRYRDPQELLKALKPFVEKAKLTVLVGQALLLNATPSPERSASTAALFGSEEVPTSKLDAECTNALGSCGRVRIQMIGAPPLRRRDLVVGAGFFGGVVAVLAVWLIVKDQQNREVARIGVPNGGSIIVAQDKIYSDAPKPTPLSTTKGGLMSKSNTSNADAKSDANENLGDGTTTVSTDDFRASLDRAPAVAPFDRQQAKAYQLDWARYLGRDVAEKIKLHNRDFMELMLIPPGEFQMGNEDSEDELRTLFPDSKEGHIKAQRNAQTRHLVRITKPFYIGKFPVTVGQFREFVLATGYITYAEREGGKGGWGYNEHLKDYEQAHPKSNSEHRYYWENTGWPQADDSPVVNIAWRDARAFCDWLTATRRQAGLVLTEQYTLPTEAQWEFACRAGTTTRYVHGDDPLALVRHANTWDSGVVKKFRSAIGVLPSSDHFIFTSPVGSFSPNNFGLHDMCGNVAQWCQDYYDPVYYARSPVNDPTGPPDGPAQIERSIRGGGWLAPALLNRSAVREGTSPAKPWLAIGFRIILISSVGFESK